MPLAAQALFPFLALLGAAVIVRRRPRRASNGWISVAATGVAGIIAMVELLGLAPGEHVDVPYLTTFPYADLAIRLDGLSLAFASVTLITAALLMLARLRLHGDRRDPWLGWLLTGAATCAVIFAHILLLVYIALQLLTRAWTGALDETARRRTGPRLGAPGGAGDGRARAPGALGRAPRRAVAGGPCRARAGALDRRRSAHDRGVHLALAAAGAPRRACQRSSRGGVLARGFHTGEPRHDPG